MLPGEDDGIPEFLKLTEEQRAAARARHASRPVEPAVAKELLETQERLQVFKERKRLRSTNHVRKLNADKKAEAIPLEHRRWKPSVGKFVDERVESAQRLKAAAERLGITLEPTTMSENTRIAIVPYLKGEAPQKPAERGKTSISCLATDAEVQDKVRQALSRGGRNVERIEVVHPSGELKETWVVDSDRKILQKGGTDITIPVKVPSATEQESSAMPSKSKTKAKANGAAKGPGVIATIVETMKRDSGVSVDEMVAVLAKKFPDRKQKSMTSTAKIQLAKNAKKKEKSEKRGLVYHG